MVSGRFSWFFMVPGRFSWFFMVPGWFFMVPGWFFIIFHGSRLVFMVPGWFFMVPDRLSWSFMVPGRLSWFFMVPGWFFHGFSPECTCLNCILARQSSSIPKKKTFFFTVSLILLSSCRTLCPFPLYIFLPSNVVLFGQFISPQVKSYSHFFPSDTSEFNF